MKWNVICYSFKETRKALEAYDDFESVDNGSKILKSLLKNINEILRKLDEEWNEPFIDLKKEIETEIGDIGICDNNDAAELDKCDLEEIEYIINLLLNDMYDLCDSARVWLHV